jgi:hypothetical protein
MKIKEDLKEEFNGLLILLGRNDAMRASMIDALPKLDPVALEEYRLSLIADLNICKPMPRNIEDEI